MESQGCILYENMQKTILPFYDTVRSVIKAAVVSVLDGVDPGEVLGGYETGAFLPIM